MKKGQQPITPFTKLTNDYLFSTLVSFVSGLLSVSSILTALGDLFQTIIIVSPENVLVKYWKQ